MGTLTDKNLFAYCDNNPVMRADIGGEFWEAVGIGFAIGWVGQYISDVEKNISSGKTGLAIFTETSDIKTYIASGVGGAIAAIPGLKLAGTMAVGAVGNVATGLINGNIKSLGDVVKKASSGAVANGIGYGVSNVIAALKVTQINKLTRTGKKTYLRDTLKCSSQSNINVNLRGYNNLSMRGQIELVSSKQFAFKSGIYSTITSTWTLFIESISSQ